MCHVSIDLSYIYKIRIYTDIYMEYIILLSDLIFSGDLDEQ